MRFFGTIYQFDKTENCNKYFQNILIDSFKNDELKHLNKEFINILEDFYSKEDSLKELENNIAKKKDLVRWENQ